jgi:hypothetical protein
MGHYKSNLRDLEFNLFAVLHLEKALAAGQFVSTWAATRRGRNWPTRARCLVPHSPTCRAWSPP